MFMSVRKKKRSGAWGGGRKNHWNGKASKSDQNFFGMKKVLKKDGHEASARNKLGRTGAIMLKEKKTCL